MYQQIHQLIYSLDLDEENDQQKTLQVAIDHLAKQAFIVQDKNALLSVHRILYQIYLSHLATPWELMPKNIFHPAIVAIKYKLEKYWEASEKQKYYSLLQDLPTVENFPSWVKQQIQSHSSNTLHPLFTYLRDTATLEQMREFFFQESPLEMLFGDIIALMLPGIYGPIKIKYLENYWDEIGQAKENRIHRNLRIDLMERVQVPINGYIENFDLLILEELELINLYLSLAINRAKQVELVGVMLATELVVPGRFEYQIQGWKRLGLAESALTYLVEHVSIDEIHAEDWLNHVVMPILRKNSAMMPMIALGIFRRLNTALAVLDQLYLRIKNTKTPGFLLLDNESQHEYTND